jgi:uncharacterized membrane protein
MVFSFAPGRRLATGLLVVSLGLNAVLVGFIGVHAWRRFEIASANTTPRGFLRMVRRQLPAADRPVLDEAVKKKEAEFAAAQADFQKAMTAAIASLRRPDFNEAEFRAAVAAARDKRLRLADLGLDVFVDTVAHISPEARAGLVPKRVR